MWPDGFPYVAFAGVMATGIVSISAGLEGLPRISGALRDVDAAAFALLVFGLGLRFWAAPRIAVSELLGGRGPTSLALVAALCVLGNEAALAAAPVWLVDTFCAAAALLWAAILYAVVVRAAVQLRKPGPQIAIDGSWLLLVVATQGVAILITRASQTLLSDRAALLAGLALFLLGAGFYAVLITLIVARWLLLPLPVEQMRPSYWINMGAAAISTLAGVRLLVLMGRDPVIGQLRGMVLAASILLWTTASWWIPLLAVLTVWRCCQSPRPGYRLENWTIVFPLGMYCVATWRLAHDAGLLSLAPVPDAFVWIALAAWALTFVGMVRSGVNGLRGA